MVAREIAGLLSDRAVEIGGTFKNGMTLDVTDIMPDLSGSIDKLNEYIKIASGVCFGNNACFEGKPVVTTLRSISAMVKNIVFLLQDNIPS